MSRPSVGVIAALVALRDAAEPLAPFEVGGHVEAALVAAGGRGRGQRGSRYVSAARLAASPLASLRRRGWARMLVDAHPTLPAGALRERYVLTPAGRAAVEEFAPR